MRDSDDYNGWLPFWRAHKAWLGDQRTTQAMITEIAKLAYLEEVLVHNVRVSDAARAELSELVPQVGFLPDGFFHDPFALSTSDAIVGGE